MWRLMVLTLFFFVLMCGLNYDSVLAVSDKKTLVSDDQYNMNLRLYNLTAADIETAKIAWGGHHRSAISKDEINLLIRLLRKVEKKNITPYNGPLPKGGPTSLTLSLKSYEKFTLIINGDHFLFDGNQIYQPEFCEFVMNLRNKLS